LHSISYDFAGSLSVADRNGSLETNESSSAENSPHHEQTGDTHQVAVGVPDFDFNVFFKTENINIPGLTVSILSGICSLSCLL